MQAASDEFQVLQSLLGNRTKRHRHRRFIVQGVRPITLAIEHGWRVEALLHPGDGRRSRWARRVLDMHSGTNGFGQAEQIEVAPELFQKLSQKDEPAELLAVVAIPRRSMAVVDIDVDSVVVVLDRPANPGNLGTIIRSCDAFGVTAVVVTGHAADPYDPAAVRASTGSLFAVPVVVVPSMDPVQDWIDGVEIAPAVIGTDEGGTPLADVELRPPLVLLFGNEAAGLSHRAKALCRDLVAIPIGGSASSLNVATAAGIVLYEVRRRSG